MEQIIQITQWTDKTPFLALTNSGNLYEYKPGPPAVWIPIDLPPGMVAQDVSEFDVIDDMGRMPKGYELCKNNENQFFFWLRIQDQERSGLFERQDMAIADARNDFMLLHPPKPPKPPKPEEAPV